MATICAKAPDDACHQGLCLLKTLGATVDDLVAAAFEYLIETGELPVAMPEREGWSMPKGVDLVALQKAFTESLGFLQVASVDAECVKEACMRGWDDFEDCLVAVTAERCRADALLARDVAGFRRSAVPAMTPDEYLARLKEDEGIWCVTEGL